MKKIKENVEIEALEAIHAIIADGTKEEIEEMYRILKETRAREIAGYEKELADLQGKERKLICLIDELKLEKIERKYVR